MSILLKNILSFLFLAAVSLGIQYDIQAQNFIKKCNSPIISNTFSRVLLEVYGIDTHYEVDFDIYEDFTPQLAKLNCDKLEVLAKLIIQTKKTLGNSLAYPKSVEVNMVESNDNAFNFSDALEIPQVYFNYHPTKDKKLTKHPKYTYAIWIHEYGHSIYNHILRQLSSRWNSAFMINLNYKNQMLNFTQKHNPILRKCHAIYQKYLRNGKELSEIYKLLNPQCQEPISKLRKVVLGHLELMQKKFAGYQKLYNASAPYEEFFADLVAAAVLNDGKAIIKSMRFSGIHYHHSPHLGFARDMTSSRNDLDVLKTLQPTLISRSVHDTLSSARRHVWKYYLSNPRYKNIKGEILKRVMLAIPKEIAYFEKALNSLPQLNNILFPELFFGEDRLTQQQLTLLKRWTYELNKRLIDRIDYQMGMKK